MSSLDKAREGTRSATIIKPTLTVHCRECEAEGNNPLSAGQIVDGRLVFYQTHHGRKHKIDLDVEWLQRVLTA